MPDPTHFSCPSRLEQVQDLTAHLKRCCTDRHVPDAALVDLELALVEAANNIVLHGYAGRSDGVIHLQVRLEDGMVALELSDDGAPMQEGLLLACRPFSLEGESGRGISIIQSCIDRIDYHSQDGVNHLALVKFFNP